MKENYPASPVAIPNNLTRMAPGYMTKAFLAILSVIVFFLLYFALITALGYLVYWAITYNPVYFNKFTIIGKIGAIAGSVMLFVFSLKFILKLKNIQPENRIKLNVKDHPDLMNFILEICKETGAPKPKYVYVDPDVNAYVSYTNLWLSLFFPTRKNLTIGMGLVNTLNNSEFKAVIAHEFGHFAQRSMRIGSYIISANTIIHDMIYTRDKWDNALAQWRASDIRLSFAAWIITPVIWLIRQVLNVFYLFLNFMHSSLSREMEFNADKVAVKAAGSEAIISALWKLDFGAQSWNENLNNAYLATQKKIFAKNLYVQHQFLLNQLKPVIQEKFQALPISHENGSKTYFSSSEHSKVSMYASHPPNNLREKNAKKPFVSCSKDTQSPWVFFNNSAQLQEEMTAFIYEKYLNKKVEDYSSNEVFEQFVTSESKGNELFEKYENTFNDRWVSIPPKEELNLVVLKTSVIDFDKEWADLKAELTVKMAEARELENLLKKAQEIAEGTAHEKYIIWEGKKYGKRKLETLYTLLMEKRNQFLEFEFVEWDYRFFKAHLFLASENPNNYDLLLSYLEQLRTIDQFAQLLVKSQNKLIADLQKLQQKGEVTMVEIQSFKDKANKFSKALSTEFENLDHINFVTLPNIETIEELKDAIHEDRHFPFVTSRLFENGEFDQTMQTFNRVVVHVNRVYQKNIMVILKLHEDLVAKHQQQVTTH